MSLVSPDIEPSTTTNPSDPDSDGDGLLDGWEDNDMNGKVTLDADGKPLETDPNKENFGDTLLDGEEVLIHGSNPLKEDTDDDDLWDDVEVNIYHTNPFDEDTHGDELSDS